MSKKKKVFFSVLFVLINLVLLVGFIVIRDATLLNDLKKEVANLSKLDVTKDRYNSKIKTRGKYAIVEKAIKTYLDDYAVSLQESLQIVQDPQLTSILSYDNYQKDGPEFTKSIAFLNEKKSSFNQNMDVLLNNLDDKTIKDYIHGYIDDDYYVELYEDLMFSDTMKDDISETKGLLERTKNKVNLVLDTSLEVLNFLVQQKDSWKLEEGEIRFKTNDLYNQYMNYIQLIQS